MDLSKNAGYCNTWFYPLKDVIPIHPLHQTGSRWWYPSRSDLLLNPLQRCAAAQISSEVSRLQFECGPHTLRSSLLITIVIRCMSMPFSTTSFRLFANFSLNVSRFFVGTEIILIFKLMFVARTLSRKSMRELWKGEWEKTICCIRIHTKEVNLFQYILYSTEQQLRMWGIARGYPQPSS